MPSKSKSQQRFMGMVRAAQKGEKPASPEVEKAADSMKKSDVEDFASTKHKGLPEKKKVTESEILEMIQSIVREEMIEGFAGALKKEDRKKFDDARRKQAEVLGYKLTGTSDIKVEIDDATIKEEKGGKKPGNKHLIYVLTKELKKLKKVFGTKWKEGKHYTIQPNPGTKKTMGILVHNSSSNFNKVLQTLINGKVNVYEQKLNEGIIKESKHFYKKKFKDKAEDGYINWEVVGEKDDNDRSKVRIHRHYIHKPKKGYSNIRQNRSDFVYLTFSKEAKNGVKYWNDYNVKSVINNYTSKPKVQTTFDVIKNKYNSQAQATSKGKLVKTSNNLVNKGWGMNVEGKLIENTVRISTFKDAMFHRGMVQLLGKKGKVSMDRKSVSALVKIIRSGQSKGSGMGRSFTTFDSYNPKGNLTEGTTHTLPNGVKVKIEFKGITLQQRGKKPVFLDRSEMMRFFKATHKYMKVKNEGGPGSGRPRAATPATDKDNKRPSKNPFSKESPAHKTWKKKKNEGKLTEDKFIAFYKKDKVTITAKSLWDAKKQIIAKLKVPKKDVGLVSVLNKTEYDKQKFRFEGKLTEANKSLPPFEISKRMMKSKYWKKVGPNFYKQVIKKFRGRGVTPKSLDKWLPDYIDGKEISKLFEGKLTEKKMDKRKAAIILKQIGGNRFIAMTGAKGFAFSDKYMSFKIGRNSKGINFVRIGHNAMDTYDMEFGFVSTRGIKVKKKVKGVYADMLGTMFKKYTGMNVRL